MKEKKVKRIMAIVAIALLLAIYIVLIVLAFLDSSSSMKYFMTAFFASIAIPIMLGWFMWMYRIRHRDDNDDTIDT